VFCQNCAKELDPSAIVCSACGTAVLRPNAGSAQQRAQYYVANSMGHTLGPFSDDAIRSLIQQQRITIKDSVRLQHATTWTPITQSQFAQLVASQTGVNRLAITTCPYCGAGLVVQIKRSRFGLILVVIGICLTPAFGIGIPIFIVGFIIRWGGKGKAFYRCARCNYSS